MTSASSSRPGIPQRGMAGASGMRPLSAGGITDLSRPDTANASKFSDDEAPKTAVKVAVRVRPPLLASDPGYDLVPARFRGSTCQVSNSSTLAVQSPHGQKVFLFDRVFSDKEDQDGIWDYVSDSVSSFVQGYNVSILAYGQSGAGKSYTMGTASPGDLTDTTKQGIVPRAANELFNMLGGAPSSRQANGSGIKPPKRYQGSSDNADKNWQMKATYVEIYNEQLRDLLVPESVPQHERYNVSIREDTQGRILLTGLTQMTINSIDDLIHALNFGSSIRQTDATAINSKSSRSHAVFSLNLVQKRNRNAPTQDKKFSQNSDHMSGNEHWITIDSKLHFVDLAGSERLKNTGLSGERVKEGISINAGLTALGKVISQLSSKTGGGSHISYRDSRLTRLLQDSLGGNAITYMIACVNPVEFHINETLNTVQYAQRARNIQSRPQIQQRAEDGDKQLVIDRLRSEVAFLREQIRSGERTERRNNGSGSRDGQPSQRENELQNQLLDMQENYSALSQRHAKLISEIAKTSGDDTGNTPALKGAIATASLDRLNRSSNFAEAVEQVVLEYEKTIQSLESSLSNSRSSLATSENSLLEREAKIVYMDAVTQQLTNRVQKSMEREAKAEAYTQDLESKIEGMGSGEERHMVAMKDLRSELARVRESESSAEEYISTLEERLAEAEQDTDIMQREIRRLEHVVERQRAVGKMDNLLSELDNIRQDDVVKADIQQKSNDNHPSSDMFHDQLVATTSASHPNGEMNPESAEEEWKSFGPMDGEDESVYDDPTSAKAIARRSRALSHRSVDRQASQAQSKALADKLETVTIELFELRVDHEKTVDELYDVGEKYQIALSTLAELQDAVDEAKTRPTSFLAKDGAPDVLRDSTQFSSSRISESVLGSHGESATLVEGSEPNTVSERDIESSLGQKEESLADHIRRLKRANAEKDINISELNENYSQLQDQHKTTLDYIEELKEELAKTHQQASRSRTSVIDQQLRRPVSVSSLHPDKEPRCFVNLRNLAVEHFQGNVKAATTFESNVSAAAAEYKLHSERILALEAEQTSNKKEMDVKNTMIAGLTRERSSKVTPMDMTMVAQLRGHLSQSQQLVKASQDKTLKSESALMSEIQVLKNALKKTKRASMAPGSFPDGESEAKDVAAPAGDTDSYQDKLDALDIQVDHWEETHQESLTAMKASQHSILETMGGLEATLANTQHLHSEQVAAAALRSDIRNETNMNLEAEKEKHVAQVTALQREIDGYKNTAQSHADKLLHLENSYAQIMGEVEEDAKTRKLTESELKTHRDLVQNLERQIEQQKSLATFHQQGLTSLQESHAKELDDLRTTLTAQQAESDRKLTEQLSKHQESTSALQEELTKAHMELAEVMQGVAAALDKDANADNLPSHVRSLAEERESLASKHKAASEALVGAQTEMQSAKQITIDLERKVKELTILNEETLGQLEKSASNEKKLSTRLNEAGVQLNSTADQQKSSSQRLIKERADLEREVDVMRNKVSQLEGQITEMKHMTRDSTTSNPSSPDLNRHASNASTLRKSNSQQNLPSPPPAMPLPPLPLDASKAPPSPALDGSFSRPHSSKGIASNAFSSQASPPAVDPALAAKVEETEARLKTVEKHLFAEKQLTSTLEEALVDLETQANKTKAEVEAWKKKCREVEEEATGLRRERGSMRNSLQQIEEEKEKRRDAERARRQLEERMELMAKKGAKKKGNLNCF